MPPEGPRPKLRRIKQFILGDLMYDIQIRFGFVYVFEVPILPLIDIRASFKMEPRDE